MRRFAAHSSWLLLPLVLGWARADVYIMTSSYNMDAIPDLEADFGPTLPEEGLEGILKLASPEDACSPFTFTDMDSIWVALIARQQSPHSSLNCTFDIKVWHAQEAGASAAIVYDDEYESLIIMSKPRNHPDPLIPSVFVSEKAGMLMRKLIDVEGEGGVHVRITPVSTVEWISMVMSAALGLLALAVVFSTFYVMRSWSVWLSGGSGGARTTGHPVVLVQARPLPDTGLPQHVLRALPVLIYESPAGCASRQPRRSGSTDPGSSPPGSQADTGGHKEEESGGHVTAADLSSNSSDCEGHVLPGLHAGETKRTCTVCLENYVDGDKLRVLPCQHRFHMACIDQWLASHKVCPMCKHDASKPLVPPGCSGTDAGGAGAAGLSGTALAATLAGLRRAWRARVSSSGGAAPPASITPTSSATPQTPSPQLQSPEQPSVNTAGRSVAIRDRLVTWMGMGRPGQRSASGGGGVSSQLTDPLLPPQHDLETGEAGEEQHRT